MTTSTAASEKLIPDYTQAPISTSPLHGAVIQTGAMFVDAYRELNSRTPHFCYRSTRTLR